MSKDSRISKLEKVTRGADETERITVYLVGDDGTRTRIKAHPDTEAEQAIYNQWVADAKSRADEITRANLVERGIIQPGDDWTPQTGVIRNV